MAGFDIAFYFKEEDRPVLEAMLSAAKRRARLFKIKMETRLSNQAAYVAFDGQTFRLDLFLERLRRDLPTIAEATPASRAPNSRRLLANGFIDIINRWRLGLYERYELDENYHDWRPTLRGKKKPIYSMPHDIFPYKAIKLANRMSVTMEMLASWHFNEVSPEVLMEEIHTAAELLMRSALGATSKPMSFPQLIAASHRRKFLRAHSDYDDPIAMKKFRESGIEGVYEYLGWKAKETLGSLRIARNQIKHAGGEGAKIWLDNNFWDVVSILEVLSYEARD